MDKLHMLEESEINLDEGQGSDRDRASWLIVLREKIEEVPITAFTGVDRRWI